MRSLVTVNEGFGIEADRIDDQRVPFIVADRLSEPRRPDVRRMLIGEIDVANLVIGLPDHQNLIRRLHEEQRMNAMQIESRNADRPTGRLRERPPLPESTTSLCLRNCSFAQGCRMGLFGSPTAIVGCRPVRRNSSLVTWGTVGSRATGPGPDGG